MSRARIDAKRLTAELIAWRNKKIQAQADGTEIPLLPDYVGVALMAAARHWIHHAKFSRIPYHLRDEVESNAIDTAITAIHRRYDPDKSKTGTAYSFILTATYFGVLNTVTASKRNFDRNNVILNAYIDGITPENQGDTHHFHVAGLSEIRHMTDNYAHAESKDSDLDYASKHRERVKAEERAAAEAGAETEEPPAEPKPSGLDLT